MIAIKRKFVIAISVCCFIFYIFFIHDKVINSNQSITIKAQNGVMNLSTIPLKSSTIIPLDGTWEFYSNKLLRPDDIPLFEPTGFISVPGTWPDALKHGEIGAKGYGTYRLLLNIQPTDQLLGIKLSNIRMSSKLFINGQEVMKNGIVGKNIHEDYPENIPKTYYFKTDKDKLDIVIQVANYDFVRGGIIQSIFLADHKRMQHFNNNILLQNFMVLACLFMLAVINIITFAIGYNGKSKDKSILIIGLICLFYGIANAGLGEKLLFMLGTYEQTELFYKLYELAFILSALCSILLMKSIGNIVPKLYIKAMTIFYCIDSIIIVILPLATYTKYCYNIHYFGFSLISLIPIFLFLGLIRRRYGNIGNKSLLVLLTAYLFQSVYGLNIIYYYNGEINNFLLGNISIVLFVLMLSIFVAFKISEAFKEEKEYSRKITELNQLKDEFLANTAHELQTPLNGIINISQLMMEQQKGSLNASQMDDAYLINNVSKKLSFLINDIMDLTKIKRKELKLYPTSFNSKIIINNVIALLNYTLSNKKLTIINNIPEELPYIYADEDRFRQIIYNMMSNAIKYTESGQIIVSAERTNNQIKYTVEDTGIGIKKEAFYSVFQAFQRVKSINNNNIKGTGLGLSISKYLAEMMSGKIWLEWSELGKGSRFALALPIGSDDNIEDIPLISTDDNSIEVRELYEESFNEAINSEGFQVLIIDDEVSNIVTLSKVIACHEYHVVTTTSAEEGLKIVDNQKIDIILLDVMMPTLSGYEVCERIREKHSMIDIPIIMLTVRKNPEDIVLAFNVGANDYITKPFELREVRARIKTHLQLKHTVSQLLLSEISFLQSQIRPHFLFNALNAISSICTYDGDKASELIDELGIFLRGSIEGYSSEEWIPIESELELIDAYVTIQKVRFEDFLDIEKIIECDEDYLIPPFIIQPLVENAIEHGLLKNRIRGKVTIHIVAKEEYLEIKIKDTGIGMDQEIIHQINQDQEDYKGDNKRGIALLNVKRRLKVLFGSSLHIQSEHGKGTSIYYKIPLKRLKQRHFDDIIS